MTSTSTSASRIFVRDHFTWLAYLVLAFYAFVQAALGPLMPFLRPELGLSYTLAGLHVSAFAAGMIVAGLTADRVAHRFGRRRTLWAGVVGMAAGVLLLVLGANPVVTIAATLAMGAVGTLVQIMVMAALADHHGAQRAVALTEATIGTALAGMAAPLAIGSLERAGVGWRWALLVPAILAVLAAVRYARQPVPEPLPGAGQAESKGSSKRKLPLLFWVYWIVIVLVVAIEWCVIFWGAEFLENAVGLSKVLAATLMALFWVAYVVGRLGGSRLARQIAAPRLLLFTLAVSAIGFPLFWLSPAAALNVAGLFVVGLGFANLFPLVLSIAVGTAPDLTNAASARVSLGAGVAILAVPLLLGSLADRVTIRNAFAVDAVLLVLVAAVVFAANRLAARHVADGQVEPMPERAIESR